MTPGALSGVRPPGTLVAMREDRVPTTVDTDRWLSLAEAARALGVSEKTARRRAKAGQLEARQVPTAHGPAWQVRVPGAVPDAGGVDSPGTQAATVLELVRLVGELQAKAEAAAMWQGRAETLAVQFAEARETIRALQAPPDPEPAPDPFPEPLPPTPNAAPWWRRWWPALVGAGVTAAVAVSSCGASGTVRHAALCGQAREVMDAGGRDGVPFAAWDHVHAVVDVAARVC